MEGWPALHAHPRRAPVGTGLRLLQPAPIPVLRPSPARADFQANGALPLGQAHRGCPPRGGRAKVVARRQLERDSARRSRSRRRASSTSPSTTASSASRLKTCRGPAPRALAGRAAATVVVDYAAPNVAKEMHVGHLRTTIIGDALCRLLDFVGPPGLRENHIGDWGTPFGMLIEHFSTWARRRRHRSSRVGDLDSFYRRPGPRSTPAPSFQSAAATGWCCSSRAMPRRCGCGACWSTRASPISRRSTGGSVCCSPATTSWARATTTTCCPWSSRIWRTGACSSKATAPAASSRPATPTGRASRSR